MPVRVRPPAPRRSKVRFAPTSFMPTAKKTSSARSLAPPFQTATAGAGLRFGFLNAHGHLFCQHNPARRKRHIACDELFHFIAKLIARSFCCSSLPNHNRLRWVAIWVWCKLRSRGIYTVSLFQKSRMRTHSGFLFASDAPFSQVDGAMLTERRCGVPRCAAGRTTHRRLWATGKCRPDGWRETINSL